MADTIREILNQLHECCTKTIGRSLEEEFNPANGASYSFCVDLDHWIAVLEDRPEQALLVTAANEFALAFLNNCQGQYRNAFKGLRLSLELILQSVYLSANLVVLQEWLNSHADTSWSAIVHNENGIFSARFCRAFFPEAMEHVTPLRSLSETLYREMSECIHGNVPSRIPLPKTIGFDEPTFELWHSKAGTLRYVANFALTLRYYSGLSAESKDRMKPIALDQLGTMQTIRTAMEAEV
ncbi:hypothetical protein JQ625_26090 [Bradyrhizobium diazoefficiens]|nr:hypothetical protein [Bradyrhizobium diazoefficiens]MBR0778316.1 hypothetical protein [Bradyrhizobium diazoefficiens]